MKQQVALSLLLFICLALVELVTSDDAIQCPQNFHQVGNKKCVQLFTNNAQYSTADATCKQLGGYLVSISSAVDNFALMAMLPASGSAAWIGLNCTASDSMSCQWDDQSGRVTYGNFMSGFPIVDVGHCVYMLNFGNVKGRWMSGLCNSIDTNFFCEVPSINPTDITPDCPFKFGTSCYTPYPHALSEADARATCLEQCSDLVSIHSIEENTFLQTIFTDNGITFIRTGGLMDKDGVFSWSDGSPFNYTNFGYAGQGALGSCMSMAVRDGDVLSHGQWINSRCETALPFICKRDEAQTSCGVTPSTPSPPANQCAGTKFLENSGAIFSPNYPGSYIGASANTCSFILNTPQGSQVQIQFSALSLVPSSKISIFSLVEDTIPLVILNEHSQNLENVWFNSTVNTMKVVFHPCTFNCTPYAQQLYVWEANFRPSSNGVQSTPTSLAPPTFSPSTPSPFVTVTPDAGNPSGCNATILTTPGTISSPNYPNFYPNSLYCAYHLSAPQGFRIKLDLLDVTTEKDCDIIVAYDGQNDTSAEIGRASGHLVPNSKSFQSSSNFMLVVFTTDMSGQDRGFQGIFSAD